MWPGLLRQFLKTAIVRDCMIKQLHFSAGFPGPKLVASGPLTVSWQESVNLPKPRFLAATYRGKCRDGQDNTSQEDFLNAQLALLKHLLLRSQYLRITLNKS